LVDPMEVTKVLPFKMGVTCFWIRGFQYLKICKV
jgi:hypothetical protein